MPSSKINTSEIIAKQLLDIKAVFFSPDKPFTWASGIKSPIYCDNRLIISYPKVRDVIETELAKLIKDKFATVKAIVGTATAGIPHAAFVSKILNMPMAYVRNKVKDHGRAKHIEGKLSYADPIVIVEDLISTGSSSIEVLNILKKDGYKVLGIVSIFSYNTKKAINNFKNAKVKCFSLTRLDELVSVALKKGIINKVQSKTIIKFRNSL